MTEQQHFPIGLWTDLLTAEDKRRMGNAVWYFLWLLNKVTKQLVGPDGKQRGQVLGGTTLPARGIAPEFGESLATVRKALADLQKGGYIHCRQNGRGYQIEVLYAKWRGRRFSVPDPSPPADSHNPTIPPPESSSLEEVLHSELQSSCTQSDRVHELSPANAIKGSRPEFTDLRDQSLRISASLPSKDIAVNIPVNSTEANALHNAAESRTDWLAESNAFYGKVQALLDAKMLRPSVAAVLSRCGLEISGNVWTVITPPAYRAGPVQQTHVKLVQYELRREMGRPITLTLEPAPESSARGP